MSPNFSLMLQNPAGIFGDIMYDGAQALQQRVVLVIDINEKPS